MNYPQNTQCAAGNSTAIVGAHGFAEVVAYLVTLYIDEYRIKRSGYE